MSHPLAEQLRPQTLSDFIGQDHLVGEDKPIRKMIETDAISSMILWGPPGSGKTSLARVIANTIKAEFIPFSAVMGGVAEIKTIVAQARQMRQMYQQTTVLFVDEIHRFNKGQQDAFLPHVEDGTIILIGATTENPSFSINAPLLSRCHVYHLEEHNETNIFKIIQKAESLYPQTKWDSDATELILTYTNGDARAAINAVELAATLAKHVTKTVVEEALQQKAVYYDKKGENHYDTISAFIKSMRGGDPDATLHYLARMVKAGEDPVFIARRMVIFASEDIGNAQPTALVLATTCMQAVQMIGMPESQLILAQTATYLATAKKSVASTFGLFEALKDIDNSLPSPIPLHLRNAPTNLMKEMEYGKGHIRYPYLEEKKTGKKIKQSYLPKNLLGKKYYELEKNSE
ncbi:replication-associated recombination protein A [Candidatus Roizmanbacteria bacterium]|nr:replication-associated recombination protein A [Candidatus Roizmanbacteria bacterium]